jgi:hypothetical protein
MRQGVRWCIGALFALTCGLALNLGAGAQSDEFARRVAERCKGEAHFAIASCGCVVRNRLAQGWTEETVLQAFYAQDVPAKDAEVWIIERVLTGYWPCDPRLYFMFSRDDVRRLGLRECDAIETVRRAGRAVFFYAEEALQ